MHRALIVMSVSLVCLGFTLPVRALTYAPTDFPTLVGGARAIALGRIVALTPRWTEGRRGIETLIALEVEDYLKGDLGGSVTVAVPGGQMGPYLSVIPGAPRFREGETVVLFLAGDGPAVPHVLGLGQGVFRIVADRTSGERIVVPERIALPQSGAVRVVRGDPARRPAPLARFAADVRALVASKNGVIARHQANRDTGSLHKAAPTRGLR
jgi:hypothetical protein